MNLILRNKITSKAGVFIDDIGIKGNLVPPGMDGWKTEVIPQNKGIRKLVWEHAQDVHCILHRIACAGRTFSRKKVQLAQPQVLITGQLCTTNGRLPDTSKMSKVAKWPTPTNITQICGFLGLCGTMRIWIKDYSTIVCPLIGVIKKNDIEAWDATCQELFEHMEKILSELPVLVPMIADPDCRVTLAVDTSYLAIGFIIYQDGEDRRRRPVQYRSLPLNERESQYGQPKLELYGLFHSLWAAHFWIAGFCNLVVEMDAVSTKGMLEAPDLQLNATMN
jgi:hypothetical protein